MIAKSSRILFCCFAFPLFLVDVSLAEKPHDALAARTATIEGLANFLEKNVIDQRFKRKPKVLQLDNGRIESETATTYVFENLKESHDGLQFDLIANRTRMVFRLDNDGNRIGNGEQRDRISVTRYRVSKRKSTNELMGIAHGVNYDGSEKSIRVVSVNENELRMMSETIGYEDFYAATDSGWKPGASTVEMVFSVHDDDRVSIEEVDTGYDVDPENLRREKESVEPLRNTYSSLPR